MNYNYPGQPDPLVLMIPQHFFDFLMERISAGSKKKRLPNSTISIIRHQPPRGKFTKYTWLLTNVLHVKQVFDTSLVLLEVSRKFSKSEDGTYQYEKQSIDQLRTISNGGLLPKKPKMGKLIKPLEWKTFVSPIIEIVISISRNGLLKSCARFVIERSEIRKKQHDFKSVHFECRMVLFYMIWEKSRL